MMKELVLPFSNIKHIKDGYDQFKPEFIDWINEHTERYWTWSYGIAKGYTDQQIVIYVGEDFKHMVEMKLKFG